MNDEIPPSSHPQDQLAFRIAYLVMGFIEKNQTEAEKQELDEWICENTDNEALFEDLIDVKNRIGWEKWKAQLPVEERWQSAKATIRQTSKGKKSKIKSMIPWLAAAALIVIVLLSWLLLQKNKEEKKVPAVTADAGSTLHDIEPGTNHATLQLGDGTVIVLDSVQSGTFTMQGSSSVRKEDSSGLTYTPVETTVTTIEKPVYNTLNTPKGGQYKVVLPDGSKVWINAASTLKYPSAFAGATRNVELSGEAYFEVAKNTAMPFVVTTPMASVKVLGTHFNVHAYPDEPITKVSLAEGSVDVSGTKLQPGQQACINALGKLTKRATDIEADLAWKDGRFLFKRASIQEIMMQVERWYDASIEYKSAVTDHFNADIPRSVTVSRLLELLEQTDRVHFTIDNKKITVMK